MPAVFSNRCNLFARISRPSTVRNRCSIGTISDFGMCPSPLSRMRRYFASLFSSATVASPCSIFCVNVKMISPAQAVALNFKVCRLWRDSCGLEERRRRMSSIFLSFAGIFTSSVSGSFSIFCIKSIDLLSCRMARCLRRLAILNCVFHWGFFFRGNFFRISFLESAMLIPKQARRGGAHFAHLLFWAVCREKRARCFARCERLRDRRYFIKRLN